MSNAYVLCCVETIAVVDLVIFAAASNQVFGLGAVRRISSDSLNFPIDLAAVWRDADNVNWASNSTLDEGSDFYVANRGNNSIVRMRQNGAWSRSGASRSATDHSTMSVSMALPPRQTAARSM